MNGAVALVVVVICLESRVVFHSFGRYIQVPPPLNYLSVTTTMLGGAAGAGAYALGMIYDAFSSLAFTALAIVVSIAGAIGVGFPVLACTEMVMPMSSSRDRIMFQTYDYNFSYFQEWCWKQFNVKPRPTWITTEFGGHDIKATLKNVGSNIIFSNGLLDPWSGGSVLQNVSESIVALVTEEGAHHIDLRFSTKGDPEWLVEQRESEIKLIQGWLDNFYQEKKAAFDM